MFFHRFTVTEDEVNMLFKIGDVDHDGSINSAEYKNWENGRGCDIFEKVDIRSFFGYIHLNHKLNTFLLPLAVGGWGLL